MEVYSIKKQGIDKYFGSVSQPSVSQKQVRTNPPAELQPDKKITTNSKELKITAKNDTIKTDYPRMIEIAHKVGKKLQSINVNIQFEVDKELGRIIIKVIDPESGEVVRKIPPEKFMKSIEFLNEMKNELHGEGIAVDVKY
jgi:flagellar protein FlaG